MKNTILLLLCAACCTAVFPHKAFAEIFDIKNKGVINGDVVSEDTDKVVIRDPDGKIKNIAKKDISMRMKEDTPKLAIKLPAFTSGGASGATSPQGTWYKGLFGAVADRTSAGNRVAEMQKKMDDSFNTNPAFEGQRQLFANMTGRKIGVTSPSNAGSGRSSKNSSADNSSYSSSGDSSSENKYQSLSGNKPNYKSLDSK